VVDDLDRAEIECEYELAEALRQRKPVGPSATGFCHYCREPLLPGERWCHGTECEREWEYLEARRRQNIGMDA
jgi:hypothetical protein